MFKIFTLLFSKEAISGSGKLISKIEKTKIKVDSVKNNDSDCDDDNYT